MPGNAGRKPAPPNLRILKGRGEGKDGQPRDSAGRPIPKIPAFVRALPQKPFDLEGDASDAWDLIVRELSRVEILKPVDALAHGDGLRSVCPVEGRRAETAPAWAAGKEQSRSGPGALGNAGSGGITRVPIVVRRVRPHPVRRKQGREY